MLDFHVTPGKPPPTGKRQLDSATSDWDGRHFEARAFSATTELARTLVAAGCPDQPWQSFNPNGRRSIYGPSVHGWAKLVTVERDRGISFEDYREQPEHLRTRDD